MVHHLLHGIFNKSAGTDILKGNLDDLRKIVNSKVDVIHLNKNK